MGWLNRRTFAYDALSMHATDSEWAKPSAAHENAAVHARLTMALLAIFRSSACWRRRWQRYHSSLRAGSVAPLARGAIVTIEGNVYEPYLWRHHRGDEILSGKRQDRHFAKIAEMLGARGLRLSWVEYLVTTASA